MQDVVALSLAARLRALGLPARRIGRIVRAFRSKMGARPMYLLTDGKTVFFRDEEGAVIDLLREHQIAIAVVLQSLYDSG
jgi:hypothetical protein